jgi:predicted nucleic acid-binding protein
MQRTFIDSGILIAAARANTQRSMRALQVLTDPNREFVSSPFIQLETQPKAIYNQQQLEVEFYATFFNEVAYWALDLDQITQTAHRIAQTHGLAGMDALHIAAALSMGADEFVTTEKPTKPMYRITEILVVSIAADEK